MIHAHKEGDLKWGGGALYGKRGEGKEGLFLPCSMPQYPMGSGKGDYWARMCHTCALAHTYVP